MKICILGRDRRNLYLKELYKDRIDNIINADVIITPVPISKDGEHITDEIITLENLVEFARIKNKIIITGGLNSKIKEKLSGIKYYDIMSFDEIATYNAIPTVEGAIKVAIENTEYTLHNSNICILGFGRIGKLLAKYLESFGTNIFCEARKENDIALINAMGYNSIRLDELDHYLSKMNIIFNTIPYKILDQKRLELLSQNAIVIDLASAPGGVDFDFAKKINRKVLWELGLPARVAPRSAAMYFKEAIDKIMIENER
ncbi:MAG: NAD(P)-dependent oxidoreductase [Clostridia bacterium]|nr:NAD(P)-dependent oxidoreductase [Clostridia bacterium]